MLPKFLEELARDVESETDVSCRLQRALKPNTKDVTRANQLELITRVLDHACKSQSRAIESAFRIALGSLRDLSPFLKKRSTSLTDTIAAVEKYAVNFALFSNSDASKSSTTSYREDELITSLRRIFESRAEARKARPNSKRLSKERRVKQKENKENEDPNGNPENPTSVQEELIDRLFFPRAAALGRHLLLPEKDSIDVAATIAGALSIRLTRCCKDVQLNEILALAKGQVHPWLEYLRNFDDPKARRAHSAYSKRLSCFLFDQCRSRQNEPATVLHTRVFALQLEDPKLSQFARNVLQSANNFSRSRKGGNHTQNVHEVLTSAYECAIQYTVKYEFSDCRWVSEDVSAWLDDVAFILAKQRPKRSLPDMFLSRLRTLQGNSVERELSACLQLQVDLFEIGAYELDRDAGRKQSKKLRHPALWKSIASHLQNIKFEDLLDPEQRAAFLTLSEKLRNNWEIAEADGYRCLRLMRILEPIRKFIVVSFSTSGLPHGAEVVLRTYLSALFRGLEVLSAVVVDSDSSGESAVRDLSVRLNKMIGGAFEAANDLIRSYANQHLFADLEYVATVTDIILKHHGTYSSCSARRWTDWLFNTMSSTIRKMVLGLKENKDGAKIVVMQLSKAVELSANMLFKHVRSGSSISFGYSKVLITTREVLLSQGLFSVAANISFRLFEYVTSSGSGDRSCSIAVETVRMAAQDAVRLLQERKGPAFLGDISISSDKLLSLFTEYSWWIRKNHSSFKTRVKYLQTLDRLIILRRGVFQFCSPTGSRCQARIAQEKWLSFTESMSFQNKETAITKWEPCRAQACSGHRSLGLLDPDLDCISCAPCHSDFLENLGKACQATVLNSFEQLTDLLHSLNPHLPPDKPLSGHTELSLVAMEALQWISTALAFNSLSVLAQQALTMANQIGSSFGIFMTEGETFTVGKLLDGLPTLNHKTNPTDEDDVSACSQAWNGSALDACGIMRTAKSSLKQSLKALWKCKTGLNQLITETFSVGGLVVDIGFDTYSFSGRHRLSLVLNLIDQLFRLGILQGDIENMAEARYYMDLCFQISRSFLPPKNNSLRRIAVTSMAKCATGKDSLAVVQESLVKYVPTEREESEGGGDPQSYYMTLQTAADAMLFIDTAWKLGNGSCSPVADAHYDVIAKVYNRCQNMLTHEKQNLLPCLDFETERIHLKISTGLISLLRGEQLAARSLWSIIEKQNSVGHDVTARAYYEVASSQIGEAGGLRAIFSGSSDASKPRAERTLRRSTRRRTNRKNSRQYQPFQEEIRTALARALAHLVPCLGNLQLCRRIWNIAGMMEKEQDHIASRLRKTVGLSFNARFSCNTSDMKEENSNSDLQVLENGMKNLSLLQTAHADIADIPRKITANGNTVVVGVHMDENKSNIVIWRQCGFGFRLQRLWLPSSGPQSYDAVLERMESILAEMKRSSVREGQEMTKAEKIAWWDDRYRLDNQMKALLAEIQEVWLGPATTLLIPSVSKRYQEAREMGQLPDLENYVTLAAKACDSSDDDLDLGDLVLLMDKPSERIPWESLPLLRENAISATRTPSLSYLNAMWTPDKRFDSRKLFYVLNPEGNLKRTESRFRERLESMETWSGTAGVTSAENVASLYEGEEIYLYCGHGAGEDFFSPSKICPHRKAPIALLMGCSSCRPRDADVGDYESNGPAIEFLTHGSAAVVGNLWDVSDGEIDRLTSSVLSLWLGDEVDEEDMQVGLSLANAVAQSRSQCRLPYLVGAACVVMGVPHVFVSQNPGD